MPWDFGGTPDALKRFVKLAAHPYVALVPGCGAGYEVACMSEAGWDVTAIDFSATAVNLARSKLGRWSGRVEQADFFSYVPPQPLGLIYERAFFCALPPERRPAIVARWVELLPPGGRLAGFFFFGDAQKGPPFGIAPAELETLLEPEFERIADDPVTDSSPVFVGRERWQIWVRRGASSR